MDDWSLDPSPEFAGSSTDIALNNGDAGQKVQVGFVGGALLSELRQRMNGAGSSTEVIPAGVRWETTTGIVGTINNSRVYTVRMTASLWTTLGLIKAEVEPP